jgi:nicotinate phosphoribosyltransferase
VRLDTPSSRKGDFKEIIREVRWELDLRGHRRIRIFVSGGLSEESVRQLSEAGVDSFGVGTYVSNSPTVNFAMDIVQIDGTPSAKGGKLGGRKEVWRCQKCPVDIALPYDDLPPKCPKCKGRTERLLKPLVRKGRIVARMPRPKEIRKHVLSQLARLSLE